MSDSKDIYYDSKNHYGDDDKSYSDDGKKADKDDSFIFDCPKVDVTEINIRPNGRVELAAPLTLRITFALDREITGYWRVQFLVDSANKRIIKRLGRTETGDYLDG